MTKQPLARVWCAALLLTCLLVPACMEGSGNQELTFVPNCLSEPQVGPNAVHSVRYRGSRTQAGQRAEFSEVVELGDPFVLSGVVSVDVPLTVELLNSGGVVLATRTISDAELARGASSYAAPVADAMGTNPDRTIDFVSSQGHRYQDLWQFVGEPSTGSYVLRRRQAQLVDVGDPIACTRVISVEPPTDAGIDSGIDSSVDAGIDSGVDAGTDLGTDAGGVASPIADFTTIAGTDVTATGGLSTARGLEFSLDSAVTVASLLVTGLPERQDAGPAPTVILWHKTGAVDLQTTDTFSLGSAILPTTVAAGSALFTFSPPLVLGAGTHSMVITAEDPSSLNPWSMRQIDNTGQQLTVETITFGSVWGWYGSVDTDTGVASSVSGYDSMYFVVPRITMTLVP